MLNRPSGIGPNALLLLVCALPCPSQQIKPAFTAAQSASQGQSTSPGSESRSKGATRRLTSVSRSYGNLPLSFEVNQGQADPQVRFLSRGSGYSLFLTGGETVLALPRLKSADAKEGPAKIDLRKHPASLASADVVRMRLLGGKPDAEVTGESELPGKANHFIGSDPSRWRRDVPTFAKVRYAGVYPGIDAVYYGNQHQLEYDLEVAPGADWRTIRIHFEGAKKMKLDADGSLGLDTANGSMAFRPPVVYQMIRGRRQSVDGRYVIAARNTVGFSIGKYDRAHALTIDPIIEPILVYSTYLGGSIGDGAEAIAIDGKGDAYVTGYSYSPDFPTKNPYQQMNGQAPGGYTVFVSEMNPEGSALIYSTFVGGTAANLCGNGNIGDQANAIALDAQGDIYLTGLTISSDFPTTPGAWQTENNGCPQNNSNAFVTAIAAGGASLIYSTYIGGAGNLYSGGDVGTGIALDANDDAYITGSTVSTGQNSTDFPVTDSPFQRYNRVPQGAATGFVAELNPTGTGLVYSTFLGGSTSDQLYGIALDSSDNAYVVGTSYSSDYPLQGALQAVNHGATQQSNAVVTKLNSAGSALVYSTFLGGHPWSNASYISQGDGGNAIALDASKNAYVVGTTFSADFPITNCALQPAYLTIPAGNIIPTGFVAKINPTGSAIVYSTYLGGSGAASAFLVPAVGDSPNAVAVDSDGNAVVVGSTASTDFPITSDAYQPTNGGAGGNRANGFLSKLTAAGNVLAYSTYFGGTDGSDSANGVALDGSGDAYFTGFAASQNNLPTTRGAFQMFNNSTENRRNAFVSEMSLGTSGETTYTSTLLSTNGNLFSLGSDVVFTATPALCGGAGTSSPVATGTVTFTIDGTPETEDVSGGIATYSTTSLTAGQHTTTASYSGDSNYAASNSGPKTVTIYGAAADPYLKSGSGQTVFYGQTFPKLITVLVEDQEKDPVPYVLVTFSGAGIQFSPSSGTTSVNGTVTVTAKAVGAGKSLGVATVNGLSRTLPLSLNVIPTQLIFRAVNKKVKYGEPIGKLTYTVTGFELGDTLKSLHGKPSETTTAKKDSPPGIYPIKIGLGTMSDPNYTFEFKDGTVTITYLGTADKPKFSPAGGTYKVDQKVAITDSTPGAKIHYTTNGTEPTEESPIYTGPISVDKTTTIKAIAIAPGNHNSAIVTEKYVIDLPPVVTTNAATAITASAATFGATAEDKALTGTVWFEYGTSRTALTSSTRKKAIPPSTAAVNVSDTIAGLTPSKTYYFKAMTETAGGPASGEVSSFTTK